MKDYNSNFLAFLNQATDPFYATAALKKKFQQAGFTELFRDKPWSLSNGNGYFITENASSIIAFKYQDPKNKGLKIVGAHTDSPCLKLKPNPFQTQKGYHQLGVEVYGGLLMAPWFDRDLGLSGRISFENNSGEIQQTLLKIDRPIAFIPNLAIHLNHKVNKEHPINPETELVPIVGIDGSSLQLDQFLQDELSAMNPKLDCKKIHAFELSLYDTAKAELIGIQQDFIASARLDNLLSCYAGAHALIESTSDSFNLLVCNDHEEVGSQSTSGAGGRFLYHTLKRLIPDNNDFDITLAKSMLLSVDSAHALHPNYADKHDKEHAPKLNHGPVIKVNTNQRYASNSETIAAFKLACDQETIPYQLFSSRNDVSCGTTIGPISSATLGIKTLDIGAPQFGMHSIRELTGAQDGFLLSKSLAAFYTH